MFRLLIVFLFVGYNSHSQDTLVVDDGSIWWSKSSCSVDYRCYENIDGIIEEYCTDSVTIIGIELRENEFEHAKNSYTECRIQRLSDYLSGKHDIEVPNVISSPTLMAASEMRQAIRDQNFRTVILIFGKRQLLESL